MKGFLEFQVLALIDNHGMCGNEIRKEISKRRGSIPSPGTIYPVLKNLAKKNFIKEEISSGKEKKYHITINGKKELIKSKKIFRMMFKGLL
jgi:PadR family transcriptional regulator, regulatory protein PadR